MSYDNDNEQRTSAIARCEATTRNHGHILSAWHSVSEHLYASICEVCGEMAWVSRPGGEKHWRIGGSALDQDCSEDARESASGG